MSRNLDINVEFLTRVEGHGSIVVDMKNGELKSCELKIIEAPRFFESMLLGRSIFEAQHITSRICGICACGHSLASIQAAEDAIGFQPSEQTMLLRKLLLNLENLDSHILHIYMLAAPDMLGAKSAFELIKTNADDVRRALRMKKLCNDACEIVAGRHVHPISCTVGGFTKLPSKADLENLRNILSKLSEELKPTLALCTQLKFPQFERETEYVALVSDDGEYPIIAGDAGSTDGIRMEKHRYKEVTNEFILPHSSAKHAKLSRDAYMVGALARYKLNSEKLYDRAKEFAEKVGLTPDCINPYMNTAAQLVECAHFAQHSLEIIDMLKKSGVDQSEKIIVGLNENKVIDLKAGKGVGAVEVPRGLLFHCYDIDANGTIIGADCVIPTGQNLENIELDMKKLVAESTHLSEEEITLKLEMLVRAYDPCISCSAHVLDVRFE